MKTLEGITIGFIGLGLMGRPMAVNLMNAGARVIIHNRSQAVVQELKATGMSAAGKPRELAERSKTIVVMVSDTPSVEQVLVGENGVVHALQPDSMVIDMGTTAVMATKRFASQVVEAGSDYLDAPVSGGEIGARTGTLTIMVGGTAQALTRARPILEALGQNITHVGDVGAGQVTKAANQMIVGLTIGAVAEALTLAQRAGVDPAKVRQALGGGFADSRILELHGQRMIDHSFDPGGKAETQRKDLAQALEFAASLNLKLPATELNLGLYDQLIDAGGGNLDHSALIKVLEAM